MSENLVHLSLSASADAVRYAMPFSTFSYPVDRRSEPETFSKIITETCEKYGLTRAQLCNRNGGRSVSWPRFEAMHRMRKIRIGDFPASFPRIGLLLGGLDHTSVMHGDKRYEEIMEFKRTHNLPTDTVFLANADQYEAFRVYRKRQSNAAYWSSTRAA